VTSEVTSELYDEKCQRGISVGHKFCSHSLPTSSALWGILGFPMQAASPQALGFVEAWHQQIVVAFGLKMDWRVDFFVFDSSRWQSTPPRSHGCGRA